MAIVALDAHCHADILLQNDLRFPDHYKELGVAGITCSYTESIKSWEAFPEYWDTLKRVSQSLSEKGIRFFYMVGIHPRSIPSDLDRASQLPPELSASLLKHLNDSQCLGLGELGLDEGSGIEEKILRWQLEWAVENLPPKKRIDIHTPRRGKESMTDQVISLLHGFEALKDRILIDHVTPKTVTAVLKAGYPPGISLQEGGTSIAELCSLLQFDPRLSRQIILNSNGARSLSSQYLELLHEKELLAEDARKAMLLENAVRFFEIAL